MDAPTRPDDELDPEALQSLARIESRLFGTAPALVHVDRYELQELLGAGGMGVVHAAWDPELRRRVAVKLVQIGAAGSAGASRLMREAQAIASISHPNVIPVHDVGRYVPDPHAIDGITSSVFVVMELVEGHDLERWLAQGPRPWPTTLDVLIAAGRGLAAAHAAGILHRDFKPSNVLVGNDGRVRVVDFGLARPVSPMSNDATEDVARPQESSGRASGSDTSLADVHTRTGSMLGTPYYMAPELLRGREASERSDQYAFAVALYAGLFGHGPFIRGSIEELTRAKRAGAFVAVPESSAVPRGLAGIALRGMAPDPDDRFPSMHAMLGAIEHLQHRRRNVIRAVLGVTAVGGAIVIGLGLGRLPDAEPIPQPAAVVEPAAAIEHVPVFAFVRFGGATKGELEWGADGLPNLMVEEIRDREGIRVVPYFRLKEQLRDQAASQWSAIAQRQGATIVISGTLDDTPDGFVLSIAAHDANGDVVVERHARSDEVGLADAARTLARDVVGEVTGSPVIDTSEQTWPITYERTLQLGIAALEQFDFRTAETHLDEARKLAPKAAEARFYGAILAEWLGRGDEAESEYRIAAAGSLSAAKRAYIDGSLLRIKHGHARALDHFREASAKYPDDIYLAYGLFEMLYHAGHGDAAIAEFHRVQELAPGFGTGLIHVMDRASAAGNVDELEASLVVAERTGQPARMIGIWRGKAEVVRGNLDQALAVFEPLAEQDSEMLSLSIGLHAVRGEIPLARARVSQAMKRGDSQLALAELGLVTAMGDKAARSAAIERERSRILRVAPSDAAAIGWLGVALHEALVPGADLEPIVRATEFAAPERFRNDLRYEMTALFLADAMGDTAAVKAAAESSYAEVRHVADALIAAAAGDHETAATHWREALTLGLDGRFQIAQRYALARSLRALGDHEQTLAVCDAVAKPPSFSWSWGAAIAPCLVWAADASAKLGDVAGARTRYERVLGLRARADPKDELVVAARAGISALPPQ